MTISCMYGKFNNNNLICSNLTKSYKTDSNIIISAIAARSDTAIAAITPPLRPVSSDVIVGSVI